MKRTIGFLSVLLTVFFISSCHHTGRKGFSDKKWDAKQSCHKGKKSCCDKKRGKKHGKKHGKLFKWSKKDKKDCCGKGSFAGFSNVKDVNKGKIKGSVFFEHEGRYKVKVTANITGLSPNQKFGFHVHEFGICENKALLAGSHLNPWGAKHSGPQAKDRHLGDLGNLESNKSGKAVYSTVVKGKLSQFLGRSVVIHAKADDMKTQPTGNSGNRIACGVIAASMPPVQEAKTAVSGKAKSPAVDKAVSGKAKSPTVDKAVSSKAKSPAVDKAVSSKAKSPAVDKTVSDKAKSPAVDKTVSDKAKPPAVDKAVSSKTESPAVDKAVSGKTESPAVDKAKAVSSTKTKNSKK